MTQKSRIVSGKYLDSVKLMLISKRMRQLPGVREAVAITATDENKAILEGIGMLLPEFGSAPANSICLAVEAETEEQAVKVLEAGTGWIEHGIPGENAPDGNQYRPRSLDSALKALPGANLALISIAGRYAGAEAFKALEAGLDVMLFSDNVPLETELELKRTAVAEGLLMMGPDCGTAILDGLPMAFANRVRSGGIGIVSAAGTGLQEVSCQIHNLGGGVSQAYGTGGRDGKAEIGGLMLLSCLDRLIADPGTEVIVLIAKLPHQSVVDKLLGKIRSTSKPVVCNFLSQAILPELPNLYPTLSLSDTAAKACNLLADRPAALPKAGGNHNRELVQLPSSPRRRYLRGLFSGGTLCYEAQLLFTQWTGLPCFSNAPLASDLKLPDAMRSREHTVIDLGADEFTVGRPHPMIDYSLRLKRMEAEAADPEVAVLLWDVVLGFGSHPAPQEELVPVLERMAKADRPVLICSVTGTDLDPQPRQAIISALAEAGAVVCNTSSEAALLAAGIVREIGRG
jgi:FdrA protein